jgi:signal transduction histidine kinase
MDITDRKLAEEALQLSEERYGVVARATNDVLWTWEVETDKLIFSESMVAKFGHETGDTTFDWWVERIHSEDRQRVVACRERALKGDASEWTDRYRLMRGDGTFADVLDRGVILRHPDGRVRRMAGALCDVTEQNRLQRQVMHADRLAAVGTLAAGVGHEINNPLAYVVSNIKYAIEELEHARRGGLTAEQLDELRQALLEADQGADRVRRIVKDLKLFANAENTSSDVVPVEQPIESAINMAKHEIKRKAVLVTNFAKDLYVYADEARLGQVFLNLLVNAAQAIPEGGPEAHRITVTSHYENTGYALIEVSDTGHGIAPEHVGQIFDPFFTTKAVGEGTGLGLSISHQIITQLGGSLSVASSPGRGAKFSVRLPAERRVTKAPSLPRVLIIDDEEWVTNGMRRLLARSFAVEGFTSPLAALEALRQSPLYDLILCDLMMPEMTGMQLFEIVRRDLPALAERFVFMTGGAFTSSATSFLAEVPNPCLEKPVNVDTLRTVVRQLRTTASATPRAAPRPLDPSTPRPL